MTARGVAIVTDSTADLPPMLAALVGSVLQVKPVLCIRDGLVTDTAKRALMAQSIRP